MGERQNSSLTHLQFYLSAEHACGYLPERIARSQVASPAQAVNTAVYSELLQHGFRRSGLHTYRPYCTDCAECIAVRVRVNDFIASRTQRRAYKRNAALHVGLQALHFEVEHYNLYKRYQSARHTGGAMDQDDPQQFEDYLLASRVDTRLVVFNEGGVLRMVSVIDSVVDGLSAVYTFFEPDLPGCSFGVFNVLWQIELVRRLGLPYLYLGYWVKDSRKMAYKSQYQPLEGLIDGVWQTIL